MSACRRSTESRLVDGVSSICASCNIPVSPTASYGMTNTVGIGVSVRDCRLKATRSFLAFGRRDVTVSVGHYHSH